MNSERPLPISVIIPTRNSMPEIVEHTRSLNQWIQEIAEVVVVDSQSQDGTPEHIQTELKHSNVKLINHPPGLYQSWNAGIKQASAKYIYIATVNDKIPFESLLGLYKTAESHTADVVLSPPEIVSPSGDSLNKKWPLHRFIKAKGLKTIHELSELECLTHNTVFLPGTLLGSSASNLYKTSFLQEHPFPTDCGHAGDSAWAIQQSSQGKWVIEPRLASKFVSHPKSSTSADPQISTRENCYKIAQCAWEDFFTRNTDLELKKSIHELHKHWVQKNSATAEFKTLKKGRLPWHLNPRAWRIRKQKKALERDIKTIQEFLLSRS